MAGWQRTHTCGDLRKSHVGETVVLNGWVHTSRKYNDQVFIDLRDRYGLTQVVVHADLGKDFELADSLGREYCLSVTGEVAPRLEGATNSKLATGEIEVKARSVCVLNPSPTMPFEVTEFPEEKLAGEDVRMQHRYVDLRRPSLQKIIALRHRMNKAIRDHLDARGFLEIETPLLGRSTPEGARDYLVPSRLFEEQWYALPQSPQLYKQLLMVAGYDKYFQIARCLRDEDLRADRQPEFTQLDVEMSFVETEDIFRLMEGLVSEVFHTCIGHELKAPFQRLSYDEAMLKYGSDKPDLRFGMEIQDVSDLAAETEFGVFKSAEGKGQVIRGINAKGAAGVFSNTELNKGAVLETVKQFGVGGLAWLKAEADGFTGSIAKFFPEAVRTKLAERFQTEVGDILMFVVDKEATAAHAMGNLRLYLAERLGVMAKVKDQYAIAWVVDFPSFLRDEEEDRWVANHHPFTSPRDEDLELLESDPGKIRAKAYDLVLNGYELGGGSIRIHRQEVQQRVFATIGMDAESAQQRFGFLLDALQYGAPPHGGIALGLDRFAMLLGGTHNIRDVIAFPKNQRGRDLMTGAPAPVEKRQLKELGLGR